MHEIQPFLDEYTERIATYLAADLEYPEWQPQTNLDGAPRWTDIDASRLRDLHIPALPTVEGAPSEPDMLLYAIGRLQDLDDAVPGRLLSISASRSHR